MQLEVKGEEEMEVIMICHIERYRLPSAWCVEAHEMTGPGFEPGFTP